MPRISVVIATRNRVDRLLTTLGHLGELPQRPPVIIVDNASSDDTMARVTAQFTWVEVISAERNLGAVARNVGVAHATTPYVAFADDDSWWEPDSLGRAAETFDRYPRLAVIAGRILVGRHAILDPVCAFMATAPLGTPADLPGPTVTGFLARGSAVRKEAFLACGGFDSVTFFMGEEARLAYDLAAAGWGMSYCDDVVAHHHPDAPRDTAERRRLAARNAALTAFMRRPLWLAARATWQALDYRPVHTLLELGVRVPWALGRRRRPSPDVELSASKVERAFRTFLETANTVALPAAAPNART